MRQRRRRGQPARGRQEVTIAAADAGHLAAQLDAVGESMVCVAQNTADQAADHRTASPGMDVGAQCPDRVRNSSRARAPRQVAGGQSPQGEHSLDALLHHQRPQGALSRAKQRSDQSEITGRPEAEVDQRLRAAGPFKPSHRMRRTRLFGSGLVRGQYRHFASALAQGGSKAGYECACVVGAAGGIRARDNRNPPDAGYRSSLLYSMSNHMAKSSSCRPEMPSSATSTTVAMAMLPCVIFAIVSTTPSTKPIVVSRKPSA